MKNKETLEEATVRLTSDEKDIAKRLEAVYYITKGAKWQSERIYSEEEVLDMLNNLRLDSYNHGMGRIELLEWFEKFKKPNAWYNEEQTNKIMNVIGQNGNDGTHYENK